MAGGKTNRTLGRRSLSGGFGITRLDKSAARLPAIPFRALKDAALGPSYALSLVFEGDRNARALNKRYRKKYYTPNVLSFPLDRMNGEIILCLSQARREHVERGESYRYFVALLFIHGMLHLKGARHGGTMEKQEKALLSKFRIRNTMRT